MEIKLEKDKGIVKVFFNGKQKPILEKYPITQKEWNGFVEHWQDVTKE